MMGFTIVFAVLVLSILLPAAFLLGRALQARRMPEGIYSAVIRQHFEIFQTGQVNEEIVEAAKHRFRACSSAARTRRSPPVSARGHAILLPGPGPRRDRHGRRRPHPRTATAAPAGTRPARAGLVLDRPRRRLARCSAVRGACRRCCAVQPRRSTRRWGISYAAETTCFMGFAGYVRQPETPLGRAALRCFTAPWKACVSACSHTWSRRLGSAT